MSTSSRKSLPSLSKALCDLVPKVAHEGKRESKARGQMTQLKLEWLLFTKKLAKNAF